jgi:hypothetical protein
MSQLSPPATGGDRGPVIRAQRNPRVGECLVLAILYKVEGGGGAIAFTGTDQNLLPRAPLHANRSYKEVGGAFRNAEARRAGTRPSLMKRGFRYHQLRVW